MAEFPTKAKVVIIGLGGIVGASIAHHLIERGWDDIVGIDTPGIVLIKVHADTIQYWDGEENAVIRL